MALYIVRPGHLHTDDRVLSASSESGRIAAPALAADANAGQLVMRTSGKPSAVVAAEVVLTTGGNPTGYAVDDAGSGQGAAVKWRNNGEGSTYFRGYIDSPYLVRCEFPVTYSNNSRMCSTPRTLPDGALGWMVPDLSGVGVIHFYRMTTAGVVTSNNFGAATSNAARRPDFVVLPSGRLVAWYHHVTVTTTIVAKYSDDYGVTWSSLGSWTHSNASANTLCMEAVEDLIIGVLGSSTGATNTHVYVSRDGGASAALIHNDATAYRVPRTCVTVTGTILFSYHNNTGASFVRRITPGGGIDSTAINTGSNVQPGTTALGIATRDDGSVWVWGMNATAARAFSMRCAVSLDHGLTWSSATANQVCYSGSYTSGAVYGYVDFSIGAWAGKLMMLARTEADTGSDNAIHLLTWGGWETIAEGFPSSTTSGEPYEHTYTPIDVPDGQGWTKTNIGAGATITNEGALRINAVDPNNSWWYSPALFFSNTAGATKRYRFRVKVASGGGTADNRASMRFVLTDGAGNEQEVRFWFSTTSVRIVDGAINTLVTVTINQTEWVDWFVVVAHDYPAAGSGKVHVWHRAESASIWTKVADNLTVAEVAGANNYVAFGGMNAGSADWYVAYIGVADDDMGIVAAGYRTPGDPGRPLTSIADVYLTSELYIGGRNGGGVPGDTYTVSSGYNYPREALWQEFRPSRQWRTTADGSSANAVFYAGAADKFKGDLVALFGTNFRLATWQMHTSDSWGAPSFSTALDATVASFTVGAGNRGLGYVGPTASPSWDAGQWRSDRDGHRWFIQIGETVYEITDNDEDRLYIEGVNLAAASGTAYIFGDRMAATLIFSQYQYARLLITAGDTADGEYHVGTVVFDKAWTPAQLYDYGFVDRIEPTVEIYEADNASRSAARKGPRRRTLAIQWPPLDRLRTSTVEPKLQALYGAIEGSLRPVVFWRDSTDQKTLMLVRVVGTYSGSNVWGELGTAVTRVDQLVLEEEL
jgi:hypothetical protein